MSQSTERQQVKTEWQQPTEYERWYQTSLGQSYGESIRKVLMPWIASVSEGTVLDIGCGPGLLLEQLVPASRDTIAVDCSPEMAFRARERFRERERSHRVMVASAGTLPLENETISLVLTVNCFEFIKYPGKAFAEIQRVLQPGGTVILGVLNRHSYWEQSRKMMKPFSNASYYEGSFFTRRELREQLRNVNLEVQKMESAVHFPPMSPGPFRPIYRWLDQKQWLTGAVLLCRARKPGRDLQS